MSEETFRWVVAGGVSLAAICTLVVAIAAIAVAVGLKKMQVRATATLDRAEPILETAGRVVKDAEPKLSVITSDAVDIVRISRLQAEHLSELITEFSGRARVEAARIDGTIEHSLEQIQTASVAVKDAVLTPVREFNGIFHGIKTAVKVYAFGRRSSVDLATQDEEMFI